MLVFNDLYQLMNHNLEISPVKSIKYSILNTTSKNVFLKKMRLTENFLELL